MAVVEKILTSVHGRKVGLAPQGNMVENRKDGSSYGNRVFQQVTSAQVLALFTTPVELIAAPSAGYAHVVSRIIIHKPAGTAYSVGTATSIVAKYTNAAGAVASGIITPAGFADQATLQVRVSGPVSDTAAVDAAAVVLHQLVANMTLGTSALNVQVDFDTVLLAIVA